MMSQNGLIEKLQSLGLTQRQLAKRLGVHESHISLIFSADRQPGKKFLAGVLREFPELGEDVMEYLEGEK